MDITSYTPAPPEFLIDFIQDDGTPVLKRGRSTAGAALLAANRAKHFEQLARGGTSTELEDEDEVQPEEYLRRAVGELGHLEHLFALLDGRVAANASKSPQYRDLLAQAATKFHVLPLADDEDSDSDAPAAAPALMPARRRVGWANAAEYLRTEYDEMKASAGEDEVAVSLLGAARRWSEHLVRHLRRAHIKFDCILGFVPFSWLSICAQFQWVALPASGSLAQPPRPGRVRHVFTAVPCVPTQLHTLRFELQLLDQGGRGPDGPASRTLASLELPVRLHSSIFLRTDSGQLFASQSSTAETRSEGQSTTTPASWPGAHVLCCSLRHSLACEDLFTYLYEEAAGTRWQRDADGIMGIGGGHVDVDDDEGLLQLSAPWLTERESAGLHLFPELEHPSRGPDDYVRTNQRLAEVPSVRGVPGVELLDVTRSAVTVQCGSTGTGCVLRISRKPFSVVPSEEYTMVPPTSASTAATSSRWQRCLTTCVRSLLRDARQIHPSAVFGDDTIAEGGRGRTGMLRFASCSPRSGFATRILGGCMLGRLAVRLTHAVRTSAIRRGVQVAQHSLAALQAVSPAVVGFCIESKPAGLVKPHSNSTDSPRLSTELRIRMSPPPGGVPGAVKASPASDVAVLDVVLQGAHLAAIAAPAYRGHQSSQTAEVESERDALLLELCESMLHFEAMPGVTSSATSLQSGAMADELLGETGRDTQAGGTEAADDQGSVPAGGELAAAVPRQRQGSGQSAWGQRRIGGFVVLSSPPKVEYPLQFPQEGAAVEAVDDAATGSTTHDPLELCTVGGTGNVEPLLVQHVAGHIVHLAALQAAAGDMRP